MLQDLIKKLMARPKERLTAEAALEHPWYVMPYFRVA